MPLPRPFRHLAAALTALMLAVTPGQSHAAGKEAPRARQLQPPRVFDLPAGFSRVTLSADGRLAALHGDGMSRLGFMTMADGSARRVDLAPFQVLSVFPVPATRYFVVTGTDPERRVTTVRVIDALSGESITDHDTEAFLATTAYLAGNMSVYASDGQQPYVLVVDLCTLSSAAFEFCGATRARKQFTDRLDYYEAPIRDLVVDAASDLLLATTDFEPTLSGMDTAFGKLYFRDKLPGGAPAERLAAAFGPARASVYLTYPGGSAVDVIDINRDFREWRSGASGSLDLARLAEGAPPRVPLSPILGSEGPGAADPTPGLVRVSDDQRALFIASPQGGRLLAMSRGSDSVEVLYQIDAGTWPLRDFDVSANGAFIAVLLGDRLLVAQPDDLARRLQQPEAKPPADRGPLVAAIQSRLAALGFYTGVIDGIWGRMSAAALDRFAGRSGFKGVDADRPQALPADLLAALFLDALDTLPEGALPPADLAEVHRLAFARFFARDLAGIENFGPAEIYTTGQAAADGGACTGLNSLPPPPLWPAIRTPLVMLERLRRQIDRPIRVLSTFQTPEYAACAGTPAEAIEAHEGFAAIAFQVQGLSPDATLAAIDAAGLSGAAQFLTAAEGVHVWATLDQSGTEALGKWHALIASYVPDARGCAEARRDVEEFARLLEGQGLEGRQVYIARTVVSDHLAVTVDAGDDSGLARKIVQIIRRVAPRSADGRTGADSFVQRNDRWFVDDACRNLAVLR